MESTLGQHENPKEATGGRLRTRGVRPTLPLQSELYIASEQSL